MSPDKEARKEARQKLLEVVPFEWQAWTADECAAWLEEAPTYFLSHTRHKEGFPAEIPGKPNRWRAIEVAKWAFGLEEAA